MAQFANRLAGYPNAGVDVIRVTWCWSRAQLGTRARGASTAIDEGRRDVADAARVLESWKFDPANQSLCQSRKARVRVQGRRGPGRRSGQSPRTTIPRARLRVRAGTGLVLRSKTPRRSRGRNRLITAQR